MGPLGIPELILIFVVALVFFGPRKLPELGRSLGKSINEFKKASNDLRSTLDDEIRNEERRTAAIPAVTAPPAEPTEAVHAPTDPASIPSATDPETIARGQHGS